MTTFLRLLDVAPDAKAEALHQAIMSTTSGNESSDVFAFESRDLAALPGAPFAHWLPSQLRSKIRAFAPYAQNEPTALQGLITGDDPRFVRLWWEVTTTSSDEEERKWIPFTKGGKRAHLYADVSMMIRYDDVGQIGIQQVGRYGRGATHYYRSGMSWPLRGTRFSAYAVPAGCIFSVGGKMAFAPANQLLASLGLDRDACGGRLNAAVAELRRLIDGERVVAVSVGSYFAGGVETEEQLEAALDGVREECARLIGAGKKVLVQ